MKSNRMKNMMQHQNMANKTEGSRSGSTLLVVIALLAILSLLGVVFYTFASQEYNSAGYFAEAALNEADPGIEADVLFNFALEQLIKGPDDHYLNSALWGKRSSLLGNMFGNDIHPYSGEAINVILAAGAPAVDQNYDGTADNPDFLNFNISPAARGTLASSNTALSSLPQPDVDYTYPDINNLFLAHNSFVRDGSNEPNPNPVGTPPTTSPVHVAHVIIPSFHRPQLFDPASMSDWYTNAATQNRIFRPHRLHTYFNPDGSANGLRFETSAPDAFPFEPTTIPGGNATQHGEMGIWTGSHGLDTQFPQHEQLVYELDTDNDGDGVREGIWMDLDFPPIEDPNTPGTYVIPLFSFTVYDLDGLLNLNTHGNMRLPGDDVGRSNEINLNYGAGESFGGDLSGSRNLFYFLSRSNMGLSSPGEINPQWALTATVPSTISQLNQHRYFFGAYPSSWLELSNMEYFFLNFGRAEFNPPAVQNGVQADVENLYAGRWGESGLLYDNLRVGGSDPMYLQRRDINGNVTQSFPRAGITGNDDNEDRFEGTYLSGSLEANSNLRAGAQSFGHPLAYNGSGRMNRTGANYRRRFLTKPLSTNPSVWPAYSGIETTDSVGHPGSHGSTNTANTTQAIRYPASLFSPTRNSSNASRSVLIDDSDEIAVDMDRVNRKYEEPFGPEELPYLMLSNTDISNHTIVSRLQTLLPHNFAKSSRSEAIRKNFTPMGWDRKQFSRAQTSGSAFPPTFASGIFRPEVAQIFTITPGERTAALKQFKLHLNELLVAEGTGTGQTISTRPLTPHPGEDKNGNGVLDTDEDLNGNGVLDALSATQINTTWDGRSRVEEDTNNNGVLDPGEDRNQNNILDGGITYPNVPTYPPQTPEQQEFWARFDRQRMARDIYTLLYTLNTRLNGATDPGYTAAEKLEMAQFAVNVVDALDPDDVLTRFEYDTDLTNDLDGDGKTWDVDDNPYTRESVAQRGVVWGVEAQQLTLSEFLMIECQDQTSDHAVTQFPDDQVDGTDDERFFSAIELRNASPYTVPFGANGKWMLGLEVDGAMVTYAVPKNRSVSAGGLFTIFSTNAADTLDIGGGDPYSEFRVDLDSNGDFSDPGELILPSTVIAAADKIDIVNDQATSNSLVTVLNNTFTDITGTTGSFLNQGRTELVNSTTPNGIKIKLFRKAHLGRDTFLTSGAPVPDVDNPWVLADEITVSQKSTFTLAVDTPVAVQAQLDRDVMRSQEREQPLGKLDNEGLSNATGNIRSTFGINNSLTTGDFTLWQPHFDRDFASTVELLSVPIVGPTQELRAPQTIPVSATGPYSGDLDHSGDATQTRNRLITYALADASGKQAGASVQVAGIQKFLDPNGANNTSPDADDNYWYRLFEYVEVPSRMHREGKTNTFSDPRTPGKMNLNTMRHASVLAALLDDTDLIQLSQYSASIPYYHKVPFLHDSADGDSRDWWEQFILARDQVVLNQDGDIVATPNPLSPTATDRRYPVPGLPGSKPFRSFDFKAESASNIAQSTLLRGLPSDVVAQPNDPRHLFEVATLTEHTNGGGAGAEVDYHTRNQILSKIMGNTTNRSNVFVVFMSVAYFKAISADFDDPDENVKIGARQSPFLGTRTVNQSDYRGFFVIDRTRAEEAFEPSTNDFDNWKQLVRYRLTLDQ